MGTVYADLILKNHSDLVMVRNGLLEEKDVRFLAVKAVVDTGAGTLVINQEQCRQLGLELQKEHIVTLANNVKEKIKIADPIEICWKNRESVCLPWVVADSPEVLLGAIPLEEMDLIVDHGKQTITGRHGEEMHGYLF